MFSNDYNKNRLISKLYQTLEKQSSKISLSGKQKEKEEERKQKWKQKPVTSVEFSWVTQLCPTPCDPMDCRMPGFPVHHQLPEFTQTHVHWVDDAKSPWTFFFLFFFLAFPEKKYSIGNASRKWHYVVLFN